METKAATCTGDRWKPKLPPVCPQTIVYYTVHILEEENKEEFDTSTNEEIVKANVNLYV